MIRLNSKRKRKKKKKRKNYERERIPRRTQQSLDPATRNYASLRIITHLREIFMINRSAIVRVIRELLPSAESPEKRGNVLAFSNVARDDDNDNDVERAANRSTIPSFIGTADRGSRWRNGLD
jgi:hypothetical protein